MKKKDTPKFGYATRFVLPLVAVVISIAALEVALRIFGDFGPRSGTLQPPVEWDIHNQYLHVMQPNYNGILSGRDFKNIGVMTNEFGFRDQSWDDINDPGKKTILFIGDSYIFGWGVEQQQRIGQILEQYLALRDCNVRVVNVAMPGWGTFHYLDALRTYSEHVEPDLVLIGLFVGNDFIDDTVVYEKYIQDDGKTENSQQHISYLDALKMQLREFLRTSPLFNLVKYNLWQVEIFRDLFNSLELKNDRIALYQNDKGKEGKSNFTLTASALQSVADISVKNELDTLVIMIPDHLQILSSHVFDGLDFDLPQITLAKNLNDLNLPFLDLLDYFRFSQAPEQLYFREDKHWSADGHAFAASILAEIVESRVCNGKQTTESRSNW